MSAAPALAAIDELSEQCRQSCFRSNVSSSSLSLRVAASLDNSEDGFDIDLRVLVAALTEGHRHRRRCVLLWLWKEVAGGTEALGLNNVDA
ncbi:hypothetical protein GYH30_013846 [Glycine max]|nr:hypothetical protein GYH30_013846 [Glycine max]